MLEANKSRLFETIFSVYNHNLLNRRFNSVRASGLDFLIKKNTHIPLIIYCNHSSWWDGLVAFQISRTVNLDSYLIMEEKNLKKYFLFRKLGAFSVNRKNPHQAIKTINYAVDLLTTNVTRTLWIFPQGEISHTDLRPFIFYHGLSKIVEKLGHCFVTSLSIRYEFLGNFKPEIFVKISEPELIKVEKGFDKKRMTEYFAGKMSEALDKLKNDILSTNTDNYISII